MLRKVRRPPPRNPIIRAGLKSARIVRGQQEAGYSAERMQRVAAANVHLSNQALPPAERLQLAKNELKGELPKIDFQGMKVLDDQALAKMQTHILDHPHLMPFQKINASTALANAAAGKVPTKSELTLLEHVFGKDTAASLGQIHTHPFKNTVLGVLNVPRSLMAVVRPVSSISSGAGRSYSPPDDLRPQLRTDGEGVRQRKRLSRDDR